MKCPVCGNEIVDDAGICPSCGKNFQVSLSGNRHFSFDQDVPRTDIAGGTLCPRCQPPFRPGAAFCENCGASATGDGDSPENPCRDSGQNFGSSGTESNAEALVLMKDMNNMMYWIIGYLVVQFLPYVGILALIPFIYILVKTPALADRCGNLLSGDFEMSGRTERVRPRIVVLWILTVIFILESTVVAGWFIWVIFTHGGFSERINFSPVEMFWAVVGVVLTLVLWLSWAVCQIMLLIDFFKVKGAVDREVRGY